MAKEKQVLERIQSIDLTSEIIIHASEYVFLPHILGNTNYYSGG